MSRLLRGEPAITVGDRELPYWHRGTRTRTTLRYYRELADYTQNDLAVAAKIGSNTLYLIETGQQVPSVFIAQKLARVLSKRLRREVTVGDLFREPRKKPTQVS